LASQQARSFYRAAEEYERGRPGWPGAVDGTPFGEAREAAVEHEQVSTREDVLAFAASVSWIANRDDREEVLAELAAMLPDGEYRFRMRANVAWAHRV
jgi:hypothetical protein